jgi:hypothetical protein
MDQLAELRHEGLQDYKCTYDRRKAVTNHVPAKKDMVFDEVD